MTLTKEKELTTEVTKFVEAKTITNVRAARGERKIVKFQMNFPSLIYSQACMGKHTEGHHFLGPRPS